MECGKNPKITLGTDLECFWKVIARDRNRNRIKKDSLTQRVIGMLNHLNKNDYSQRDIPRRIKKVGDLYILTEKEILYGFKGYKKKTWIRLNDILSNYELPLLKFPQEYTNHL